MAEHQIVLPRWKDCLRRSSYAQLRATRKSRSDSRGRPDDRPSMIAGCNCNSLLFRLISIPQFQSGGPDKKILMGNSNDVPTSRRVTFGRANNQGRFVDNTIYTTKYSYLTFIPHALLLQFIYPRNFVFLASAILQSIPAISNLSPWTAILPLIFVIMISVIREGWQDWKKRRRDWEVNARMAYVLQNGTYVQKEWQNIQVGDYVTVVKNSQIPADMLLLQTPDANGVAYVQTSNLDGERNLKAKQSIFGGTKLAAAQLQSLQGAAQIDSPNMKLTYFDGIVTVYQSAPIPLTQQNLLLRGTSLQNIGWATGLVVYTGMDTKIMRNLGSVRNKINRFEVMINWIQLALAIFLFFMCLTCALVYRRIWSKSDGSRNVPYLFNVHHYGIDGQSALVGLSSFLLLNTIIPLSLNISLELIAAFQSDVFEYDIRMSEYIEGERIYCIVNNSHIIPDLGIIKYILTDKTGTLTSNQLELKGALIGNQAFTTAQLEANYGRQDFGRFWLLVLVCNDIIKDEETKTYQGSSADEVCFVNFASRIGYVFEKRQLNKVYLSIRGQGHVVEILQIISFDQRKMMSVIFRDPMSRSVMLATKGADSSVLPRSTNGNDNNLKNQITSFSKEGYRTLVFAQRRLNQQQATGLISEMGRLKQMRLSRQITRQQYGEMYARAIGNIQNGLAVVGVTAIEDKLQFGVPEAIKNFRMAGLQVAMITGDKLQTAENIGYLSNFIDKRAQVIRIRANSNPSQEVFQIENTVRNLPGSSYSVIIEGDAIPACISNPSPQVQLAFANVIRNCSSVIFCRSTPSQKGLVVAFYKRYFRGITAAIGDGGNDVRMIQQADVGIGILGKEGNQASSAADFSICQFRFTERLILHHGRWTLYRMAFFFNYYGFKVTVLAIVLFCYLAYAGESGTSLLPNGYLAAYNSALTVVLPIAYAVYDQDINVDLYPPVAGYMPIMYRDLKLLQLFSYWRFTLWTAAGIVYAVWLFFTTLYVLDSTRATDNHGRIPDHDSVAMNIQLSMYFFVTLVMLTQFRTINIWIWFLILFLTLIIGLIFFIIETYAYIDDSYWSLVNNFNLRFWLLILVNTCLGFFIRYIMVALDFTFWPNSSQVAMLQRNYLPPPIVDKYAHDYHEYAKLPSEPTTAQSLYI